MIIVYSTAPSQKEAEKIATYLVKNKSAGCVNILPILSIYKWQGKLLRGEEFGMMIKTTVSFDKVKKEIEKIHSYDIPCIIKIPASANKKFETWIRKEVKK